jgi:hypothetical protein
MFVSILMTAGVRAGRLSFARCRTACGSSRIATARVDASAAFSIVRTRDSQRDSRTIVEVRRMRS